MSLEAFDGFESYVTTGAAIQDYWDSVTGASTDSNQKRNGSRSGTISGSGYLRRTLSSAEDEFWFGFAMRSSYYDEASLVHLHESGTTQVSVQKDGNKIYAYRGTKTGTLLGSTTGSVYRTGEWYHVEVYIKIHDSAGVVNVKMNGVEVLNLTSQDTQATANAYADVAGFGYSGAGDGSVSGNNYWDDVYIISGDATSPNSSIGDVKVNVRHPDGAGNYTQWTPSAGSNYQCVDEAISNGDSDYVSETTANDKDSYTFQDLAETSPTIYGVKCYYVARKDDAGSRSMRCFTRVNSTDYTGDTENMLDAYNVFLYEWQLNPNTSTAWTKTTLDGAEFGVELIS